MSREGEHVRAGLCSALSAIEEWRADTEASASTKVSAMEAEADGLRVQIASLQVKLQTAIAQREEAAATLRGLPAAYERRAHDAILSGLQQDEELITARAGLYQAALEAREARAKQLMEQPGIAAKISEFEDFEANRTALLAALPKSYHGALLMKHDAVRAELQPLFDTLSEEIQPVANEQVEITLIASMDSVEDRPEALAVILPVRFLIHSGWETQPEDLHTLLAYRVVAAVSAALHAVGVPDAPVVYAPYEYGDAQLAIQVWLKDSSLSGPLEPALEAALQAQQASASELSVTGLQLAITWQSPEVIAPSTPEQEG